MSFIIAPMEIVTNDHLTSDERLVLLALYSFAGVGIASKSYSLQDISERSSIGDTTRISKIITALIKKGWVTQKTSTSEMHTYVLPITKTQTVMVTLVNGATLHFLPTHKDNVAASMQHTKTEK